MAREEKPQRPITEDLGNSKDVSTLSGQSTPSHGSFHNLPILTATPMNTSKSALNAQQLLAACESLVMATTRKKQGPTTPRRCRPTHGLVTIKTHPSQQTGFPASLCIDKDFISVVSGADLDDTILSMPLPYAELNVVPGHDNVLDLKVKTPGANRSGIFVVVSDCSARDKWLEVFSGFGVKIEGASWQIRLTSEAESDRLCSKDDLDGRALTLRFKRETQTQQPYRTAPRLWAPSRIRFTNEDEFDRLCSNDEPDSLL